MGYGYDIHCDSCDFGANMSKITAFYIATGGRLEMLTEEALNSGEVSYDDHAGFFSSYFCQACGHVTEIPTEFNKIAETYIDHHGSLAYGSRTIKDTDEVNLACESCGGKVLDYRTLPGKIKRVPLILEEAKSFLALAVAVLAFRGSWTDGKEPGFDGNPTSMAQRVKELVWEGLNPRLANLSRLMSWNVSHSLLYLYFIDKPAFSEILIRFLDYIIAKEPFMVEDLGVLAPTIALDPSVIPPEYVKGFEPWFVETINGHSITEHHSIKSVQHRLALFAALATVLYPHDKALVEKRIAQFSSCHSVAKQAAEINTKVGILKGELKKLDVLSPAEVKKRLLETIAFLSPPPGTRDWLTDEPKGNDETSRDNNEVGKMARKCCEGLGSMRDEYSASAAMSLLKRLDSMRDITRYLGCPRCKKGILVLTSSWMS